MNAIVMGCGRTGARIAGELAARDHNVTVVDVAASAFDRLPTDFVGECVLGNGMDRRTLERAGIERADLFIATTQGDNRNVFASQLAAEIYRVPRVICRLYDPERERIFASFGLETLSPTRLSSDRILEMVETKSAGE